MIGPKVYIFGGEADGEYFNDLWCFDLSTCAYTSLSRQTISHLTVHVMDRFSGLEA